MTVASDGKVADEALPAPCGLEEAGDPALKICPSYATYDEDGEETGEAQAKQTCADCD